MSARPHAACVLAVALAGCSVPHFELGPTKEYSFVAESTAVDQAEVEVFLGLGTLVVEPDSEHVLEAECRTNVTDFRPRLLEQRRDGVLHASLSSGQQGIGFNVWEYENLEHYWQVRLGRSLPMTLDVDFGAGEADLELGGLPLLRLNLDVGMAGLRVNFAEPNPEVLDHLVVDAGAVELKLTGLGNANMEKMTMDCGMGEYHLDFRGAWARSATVHVEGSMGELKICVPDDIGVRVTTDDTFLASVSNHALRETRTGYVNDLFENCDILLDIHVEFSFGEVSIRELEEQED